MKITIKKYDPTVDEMPYYKDYDVPIEEYMTLHQALVYIDENHESLAYDYSCRGRICGRCAVMFDGIACTACTTGLTDSDHTVEPLKGLPVIRDLVVNKSAVQDTMSDLSRRVVSQEITWEEVEKPIDPHAAVALNAVERCARCLVCQTSCPVVQMIPDDFVGPTGLVAIALRHYDPYDEGDRVLQAVNAGLWNCTMCGICDEVCPALEIEHVTMWQELRDAATARGMTAKVGSAMKMGAL
ncbi:MAG: 4Fe-4S dicluster domain-containing protein [Coriobacteriales bacterium]|jgi:succinate dehydrogenase/fumarate reductase iron-sulfur protein|nr:4Fe-4S dicluster domain-containing protein [Coriobacteriales bacterium]